MKKIIPFKKSILFKTNLSEVTSISLEDNLKIDENLIFGEFIISGEYKMNESSINTEPFIYNLPVEINVDDKYDLCNSIVEVSDFYYEIVNNSNLNINIEVTLDKLEEKIIEEKKEEIYEHEIERTNILEEVEETKERCVEPEETLFKEIEDEEMYTSYSIYIVREGDTIESILSKYSIDKEKLQEYNDLKDLKIGDKLIIPSNA